MVNMLQVPNSSDIPKKHKGMVFVISDQSYWITRNGKAHSTVQPAIVYNNGSRFWCNFGKVHRTKGLPAIEWCDGSKEWVEHNLWHRLNGPARLLKTKDIGGYDVQWFYRGKLHNTEDFPAIVWGNGSKEWYRYGQRHRINGPAVIHSNGHKEWWMNGQLHRGNGPAIENIDGKNYWFQYGKTIKPK